MSKLFDDASLAMIPSAYKDGKLYSIKPVPEYGSEEVTNRDFATDSTWIKSTGWTITGGQLVGTNTSFFAKQNNVVTNGKEYRVEIDVASVTAGKFRMVTTADASTYTKYVTAAGTYVFDIKPVSSIGGGIEFVGTSFTGAINSISVKEITNSGDFTFSRGSNLAATRVDVNGLIEKGRENLLLQSNQFDTTWALSSQMLTPVGGQNGYDGSNDAWKIQRSDASGRFIQQIITQSGVQTLSVYAKKGNVDYISLVSVGGQTTNAIFSLPTDGSGTNTYLDSDNISTEITHISNGWYRVSATFNESITDIRIYPSETATAQNGVITDAFIYIQDAQLEQGLVATDYIETGASTEQAGILEDMPRLDYSGSCPSLLLEPSRTNIVSNSEYVAGYFSSTGAAVTYNQTISPEGVQNAFKITSATDGQARIEKSRPVGGTDTYTLSVFFKAGNSNYASLGNFNGGASVRFNLADGTIQHSGGVVDADIVPIGNDGWYRCYMVFQEKANQTANIYKILVSSDGQTYFANNGDYVYAYGAQLELGSYPTSYIPTYGTSQTRLKDDFVMLPPSDFVQNGGTFMIELEGTPRGIGTSIPFIQFGHTNPASYIGFGATGNWRCRINDNGTSRLVSSPVLHEDNVKLGIRYGDFGYEYYANGSSFSTYDTAIDLGDFSNISFAVNENYGILRIKQILTFPTALTDSECIALTTL